jgi:hypothetical protein
VPFLLIFPLFPSVLSTKIGSPFCVLLWFFQSKKYCIELISKLSLFKGQDKRVTVQYSAWKHQLFGKYKGNIWGDMQKKGNLTACARTGRHEVAYCLKVQSIWCSRRRENIMSLGTLRCRENVLSIVSIMNYVNCKRARVLTFLLQRQNWLSNFNLLDSYQSFGGIHYFRLTWR